ncbi:hypothetical protein FRC09_009799 [Ceratobasidium sp. 395]|nr:hypothetical protein FRC09_009799 [Ceratobasidium sp. 395]
MVSNKQHAADWKSQNAFAHFTELCNIQNHPSFSHVPSALPTAKWFLHTSIAHRVWDGGNLTGGVQLLALKLDRDWPEWAVSKHYKRARRHLTRYVRRRGFLLFSRITSLPPILNYNPYPIRKAIVYGGSGATHMGVAADQPQVEIGDVLPSGSVGFRKGKAGMCWTPNQPEVEENVQLESVPRDYDTREEGEGGISGRERMRG